MKAYKFRGADQIPFALDIILNNRLYCADWRDFNDSCEGMFFALEGDLEYEKIVEAVIREKKEIRICSLSKTYDSHLLWAHYASGFSGLAIEVDLPEGHPEIKKKVDCSKGFTRLTEDDKRDPSKIADKLLSSKHKDWAYEKETRILRRGEWFPLPNSVRRVICGHRMNPAMLEALRIICDKKGIEICKTDIQESGEIRAVPVPPLNSDTDQFPKI